MHEFDVVIVVRQKANARLLSKLPRLEKKLRVMLDWTLDLAFSKDLVQFLGATRGEVVAEVVTPEMSIARPPRPVSTVGAESP